MAITYPVMHAMVICIRIGDENTKSQNCQNAKSIDVIGNHFYIKKEKLINVYSYKYYYILNKKYNKFIKMNIYLYNIYLKIILG